ncbi:hypothetical protein VKT23_014526 [Stygiomarasmius scandens]|uniref:Uncharacterized protein n=1 Tax=Marasmiellus scandens TaxID=2682957 RepID=A0ABR1J0J0_9AGAR
MAYPALTTLIIGHYHDLDDDNEEPVGHFDLYPHLASLATRSVFALETFELQYTTEITYLEILAFIRSNPSIGNLSVIECDTEITSLCYGLTVTKDKPIGPNLTWIQLSQRALSEGEDDSDLPNISRMVASRWRPCPTETELVVTANDEPTAGGEISFRVTHVPVKEPAEVRKLEEGVCLEFGFSLPEEVLSELWECEEEGMPLELETDSSESEN